MAGVVGWFRFLALSQPVAVEFCLVRCFTESEAGSCIFQPAHVPSQLRRLSYGPVRKTHRHSVIA